MYILLLLLFVLLPEPLVNLPVFKVKIVKTVRQEFRFSAPVIGHIRSPFGRRGGRMHTGIDIVARKGVVIKAVRGGVVKKAGYYGGYGYMISIRHDNGYVTRYAHCSALKVKVGSLVREGESIGLVGSTGRSTGDHLHFEVMRDGKFLNPQNYLKTQNITSVSK